MKIHSFQTSQKGSDLLRQSEPFYMIDNCYMKNMYKKIRK